MASLGAQAALSHYLTISKQDVLKLVRNLKKGDPLKNYEKSETLPVFPVDKQDKKGGDGYT